MGLKNLLKKIACKMTFCVGSKCTYNEEGKGKIKITDIDIDETFKDNKITDWCEEVESSIQDGPR